MLTEYLGCILLWMSLCTSQWVVNILDSSFCLEVFYYFVDRVFFEGSHVTLSQWIFFWNHSLVIEEVYDGVHDGLLLGTGISGSVRLCTHKATSVKYAVKCLELCRIKTEKGLQQLQDEIAVMCQLDHPNIVRLEEVYESSTVIYLVEELCTGGELFDQLDEQPDYHYTESQRSRLVKQMLGALSYIHSKGVIHRDLKLENFLFSSTDPDSELKMIDFGLSQHFNIGDIHIDTVGTPYAVAPEVINGMYDEQSDLWAMGVIAFLLHCGDPPFGGCGGMYFLSISICQCLHSLLFERCSFD